METKKDPEQAYCELLRAKIAQAIPPSLMPAFQEWVTLEQSLAYSRGRQDEADSRDNVQHFEPSSQGSSK